MPSAKPFSKESSVPDQSVDYLVVGAGPAGLQLAYFLHRAGLSYLVVEAGSGPGTFFTTFPRHRKMISVNKVHTGWDDPELNMRMDWNSLISDQEKLLFTRYTDKFWPNPDVFVRYLADFVAEFGLNVRYDTRISRIQRDGDFVATAENGDRFRARRVIAATGVSKPYVPAVEGIELAEQYQSVSVDPDDFTDQRVLIVGKGNSAYETADNLTERAAVVHVAGPHSQKLAWRTHFVGHLRAINANFLDMYQLKLQNAVLDGAIEKIERDGDGFQVSIRYARRDVLMQSRYDRVIFCTGFRFDASIFDEDCRPALAISDRFPEQTPAWESVNVPDLYFAGTITQIRDFKKSTSAFIHGFRYGARALANILASRYESQSWPARPVTYESDPGLPLADAIIARVNRTSALWQQFAFIGDLVAVGTDGSLSYHEELPVDYVQDSGLVENAASHFVITLEYGEGHDQIDPFDIEAGRNREGDAGHDQRYLHPVIRHWHGTELVAMHRMDENLENDWAREHSHRQPLAAFLSARLTGEPAAARP
jgi:thioredoxin reductase